MYDALTSGKDYAHFTVLPERSCQIVVSLVRQQQQLRMMMMMMSCDHANPEAPQT